MSTPNSPLTCIRCVIVASMIYTAMYTHRNLNEDDEDGEVDVDDGLDDEKDHVPVLASGVTVYIRQSGPRPRAK